MVRFDLMCLPEYQLACRFKNPERFFLIGRSRIVDIVDEEYPSRGLPPGEPPRTIRVSARFRRHQSDWSPRPAVNAGATASVEAALVF
jgi:hypothetical protein